MTTTEFAAIDVFRSCSDELLDQWQENLAATGAAGDFLNNTGELKAQTHPVRLQQVFANLVGNSIKFSPKGRTARTAGK